ncbi:MAG TPA: PaaI family thioesterase [Gemmatimonadales bacterium]|jgi:uncharacterized protein (TIGR00369 family)|nr:PaaI family thioesterase [Gemmatimonadales bacterium]
MTAEQTLAQWRAEEQAVRARLSATAGVARPEQLVDLTGVEMLQGILDGRLPRPPIGDTLALTPIRFEAGLGVFQGRPEPGHYNPLGVVHGGWITTVLDSAMGCAVHSTLPAGKAYTTLELKVNFIRPVTLAVQLVRAEGRLIHAGRQVATAEGRLVGPDGKLYAHATTTCLIFDRGVTARSP